MQIKLLVVSATLTLTVFVASGDTLPYTQEWLEEILHNIEPDDYFPEGEPPYVPHRNRDALPEFRVFFDVGGWSTNQLVEGLILAMTNNLEAAKAGNWRKNRIASRAAWKLSEIDNPAVTNFFRCFNDADETPFLKTVTIPGMFYYTNLEPDVLAYMRTLCVRTNVYCEVECNVMLDMFKTLSTMPDEFKPAATNRVAKYMYFAIRHTTRGIGWQDSELSNFIPAYSNSLQRLSAMRYVSTSATNTWERSNASQIVQRLESLPTNQLNDVSWIAEED